MMGDRNKFDGPFRTVQDAERFAQEQIADKQIFLICQCTKTMRASLAFEVSE
jgi:hypothetical protein